MDPGFIDSAIKSVETMRSETHRFMSRMGFTTEQFLDEVCQWYQAELKKSQRTRPVAPSQGGNWSHDEETIRLWMADSPEARQRRLETLTRFENIAARHLWQRNARLPLSEYLQYNQEWEAFVQSRAAAGFPDHPTILGEGGRIALIAEQYETALERLDRAVVMLRPRTTIVERYDFVRYSVDLARCCLCQRRFDRAAQVAAELTAAADAIDCIASRADQQDAIAQNCTNAWDFCPAAVLASFANCDRIIQSDEWVTPQARSGAQRDFNFYWSQSAAPKEWSLGLRIAAITDERWCERVNSEVSDIAENLYVQMGSTTFARCLRQLRAAMWNLFAATHRNTMPSARGSNIDAFSRAAAVLVLACGLLGSPNDAGRIPASPVALLPGEEFPMLNEALSKLGRDPQIQNAAEQVARGNAAGVRLAFQEADIAEEFATLISEAAASPESGARQYLASCGNAAGV